MNAISVTMLFLLAVYLLHKLRRALFTEQTQTAEKISTPYPAAAIAHDEQACTAVCSLGERRFLAWDAPNIPVPGCNKEHCDCHYECFPDRRAEGGDRRFYYGNSVMAESLNRRAGLERREHSEPALFNEAEERDLEQECQVMTRGVTAEKTTGASHHTVEPNPYAWDGQEWSSVGRAMRLAAAQRAQRSRGKLSA